jgi:hypothetical protein
VLAGSARLKQRLREKNEATAARQESGRKEDDLERKRGTLRNQIAVLQGDLRAAELASTELELQRDEKRSSAAMDRISMGKIRKADPSGKTDRRVSKMGRNDETASGKKAASEGNGQRGGRRMGAATLRRRSNAKVRNGVR